jgi:integrase
VTADRARVALSGFFGWAVELGLMDQNPTNDLKTQALTKSRERTLTEAELLEVWRACEGMGEFGSIVKLLILTGQRRAEIGDLAWSEVDLDKHLVELPPRRVKNNRHHLVPLAKQAYAIIEKIPRNDGRDLMFGRGAGGFAGWSKSKRELDVKVTAARKFAGISRPMAGWVLHDLRRCFVTHVSERNFGQPHAIEAVVNHLGAAKSGIAGVYNKASYLTEKREILQRWADHLVRLVIQTSARANIESRTEGVRSTDAVSSPSGASILMTSAPRSAISM